MWGVLLKTVARPQSANFYNESNEKTNLIQKTNIRKTNLLLSIESNDALFSQPSPSTHKSFPNRPLPKMYRPRNTIHPSKVQFKTLAEADPSEIRHLRPSVPHKGMSLEEILSISGICGTSNQIHICPGNDAGSVLVSFASPFPTGSVSFSTKEADIAAGTGTQFLLRKSIFSCT